MDLTALIAKARRLLNERTASFWQDSDITAELNNALYEAEARISRVAPWEFLKGALINLTVNVELYERATYEPLAAVRILDSGTGRRKNLRKLTHEEMQDHADGFAASTQTRGVPGYGIIGKHLLIRPAPTASVTNGLACLFYEKVPLVAAADAPRMPVPLHHRIAYRAADLALNDSKEASDDARQSLRAEWNYYFGADQESARRLFRDHYYDRQATTFIPAVEWAT